jgi:8-oxo-dGTP pyrophosphatase MutT (NUDIX family)
LLNEEHVDAAIRELHEEISLIMTHYDLTMLSDAPACVAVPEGQQQLVYVFSASVPIPYVSTHLRTHDAQLEQYVTAESTSHPYSSYVVPETIDIDGLSLTPAKQGLLPSLKLKYELFHFGYVTQWETFRRGVYTHHVLGHDDTSIPRQFQMYPRFTSVDSGHVWMLQLHKDEMQARTEPSTAPHFVRGDKVSVVTTNLFLRGQTNRKLNDRQLGPFSVEEQIGKHNCRLKLPATVRLHHVLHVNNLLPCSTAPLRPFVPVTVLGGDDEKFDVSPICVVCIKSLPRRRGKYLLFMTHFSDDDIPLFLHQLNEVHRTTALHNFLERDTPMAQVCQDLCVHRLHARSPSAHS